MRASVQTGEGDDRPSLAGLIAGSAVLGLIPFILFLIWAGPIAQGFAVMIIEVLVILTIIQEFLVGRRSRRTSGGKWNGQHGEENSTQ